MPNAATAPFTFIKDILLIDKIFASDLRFSRFMDTTTTRKIIGFPKKMTEFAETSAVFDQHSLRISNHAVMEDWERDYMNKLASIATKKGGRILEVGYGLGLSANAIQQANIASHVVIEMHPEVIAKCITECRQALATNRMHIYSGLWQELTPTLASESFDGILFDTYPLTEEEIHCNHFWFFGEAYRLLKPGGILTYYSDEVSQFSSQHFAKLLEAGFKKEDISFEIFPVDPPSDCEYWQAKTIIAPLVIK